MKTLRKSFGSVKRSSFVVMYRKHCSQTSDVKDFCCQPIEWASPLQYHHVLINQFPAYWFIPYKNYEKIFCLYCTRKLQFNVHIFSDCIMIDFTGRKCGIFRIWNILEFVVCKEMWIKFLLYIFYCFSEVSLFLHQGLWTWEIKSISHLLLRLFSFIRS